MSDADALPRLPELFGRAALALAMDAALGFAIATIARSQLAGIGVGIGLFFVEGIAGIFLPDVFKWFPFSRRRAAVVRAARTVACDGRRRGAAARGSSAEHRESRRRRSWLVAAARRVASPLDGAGRRSRG